MSQKTIIYYCLRRGFECFEDYINSLDIINRKVYYNNPTELDRALFADPSNIHIFRYSLPAFLYNNPRVLVLNTEQLTEAARYKHIAELVKNGVKIIDYSLANIKILSTRFPNSQFFYLPYQYQEAEVSRLKRFSVNPQTDVGIVHCATIHRQQVLRQIKNAGLKVVDIRGWKDTRDRQIGQCKILLNVHFQQGFQIFEQIRCDRWLFAGKPVVSEACSNPELLDICSQVTFSNQLVAAVKAALKNYTKPLVPDEVIKARRQRLENFINHVNQIH